MNKIHKVIWSRCSNEFVVVSEIAGSRSARAGTQVHGSSKDRAFTFSRLALALGVALGFGTSPAVFATVVTTPGTLLNETHESGSYSNAITTAPGSGDVRLDGGLYAIEPTAPNDTRPIGDTNPYAAVWVNTAGLGSGDEISLINGVQVKVNGDNLHGVYLEDLRSWGTSVGTQLTATGSDVSGMFVGGTLTLMDGTISVSGANAKGLNVSGGYADIGRSTGNGAVINVAGTQSITGIDVQGGGLMVRSAASGQASMALTVNGSGAGTDATGIRFAGTIRDDGRQVNRSEVRVNNAAGRDTTGVLIDDPINSQGISIADTVIGVSGNQTSGNAVGVKIDGRNNAIHASMDSVALTVSGAGARGVLSMGGRTSISATDMLVEGDADAWAAVSDRGTLDVTNSAKITAKSAGGAIGVYGSGSSVTLSQASVAAEGGGYARGVLAELDSVLKITEGTVRASGGAQSGSTLGISSSTSSVEFDGTDIAVDGVGVGWKSVGDIRGDIANTSIDISHHSGKLVAVDIDSSTDIQIRNGSSLSARGNGVDNNTVIALQATNGASVSVEGASLLASAAGGNSEGQGVVVESGSGATLKGGTQIKVDVDGGFGVGLFAKDAQARVFDSVIDVAGEIAVGVGVELNGKALVNGSTVRVQGLDTAIGLGSMSGGVLDASNSVVQVKSDSAAIGVYSMLGGTTRLESTNIDVSGNHGTNAVLIEDDQGDSVLIATGGTQLSSSHAGIVMYSTSGRLHTALTDTTLTAGSVSFASLMGGDGTHRIDLGSGVKATANDGTLLHVQRTQSVPTGRVELNIVDGAVVAGAIRDDAVSLAELTADGGTHVLLNNAAYAGSVENVRTVTLANNAGIGGGSVAAPNTVLENVSVDNAVLSGNWKIAGTLQAGNNGRVAPGNSIGVVTANAINWNPGTIYEVEVNAAGDSDRVDVTGPAAADISQTALHVRPEAGDGDYRLGHDYTILTAAGGVNGQFTTTDWLGSELITVSPVYGPNAIVFSLGVNEQALSMADFTANQRATAQGASSVAGRNAAVDAAFLSADPAASFDLLSGEIHPSTRAGLMASSTLASNAILGRLRHRSHALAGTESAPSDQAANYPLWVSYAHNQQTAKGDDNTARRKHSIDSFSLGGDADVGAGWKVGGAFAYSNSKVKLNERRSSSDVDSYGLAVYAGNSWEKGRGTLNFMAGLGHTWHDISTRRNVDLGGAQTLKADYDARTTQLFGELGYAMPLGARAQIEPYLGLTWLQHHTDSFAEGGGAAALEGSSGNDSVTFGTLGVRTATTLDAGKTALSLHAGLGWRHAFGDRDPQTKLTFIQGGGDVYAVTGAPIARNTAVFNLGAEAKVGRSTTIGLGYEGQAGSGFTEHAGNLYLKTRF